MTEKHYIVTHYADGTPSDTRELSDEEYAELTSGGLLNHEPEPVTAADPQPEAEIAPDTP